ncbi:FAD-binding oxidoreductase [Agromyces seonyuensis]|uniref:FAD-binding protein n=1 Tax=Agromyces seonyuensis TaxID=2662446 RepID=A0A6I4P6H0_9MICO|nr:FAD-binding protein [Agromyces seonyuensis]MWC00200.1 FAD-binding protein [Agromyces seonyuensis]
MSIIDERPGLDRRLDPLARALGARLIGPGDPTWDAARAAWHLGADQHPLAVVVPDGVEEARLVLEVARDAGARVSVQPSGHGAGASLEGTILVRPSAFDELAVDADAGTLRLGSALRWQDALAALAGTGRIAPAGSSGVVTPAGYLLNGGHSWFSRTLGAGARSLRAVELLTADGELRRIDDASDPEAAWAIRGAGGALGIVTALELDLAAETELVGGSIVLGWDDAPAVLALLAELAETAPPELEVHAAIMRMPDAPMLPPELRGARFVELQSVYRGSAEAAEPWFARLRAAGTVQRESLRPFGIEALASIAAEPSDPSPGDGFGTFARDLSPATAARLFGVFDDPASAGLVALTFRLLGGALASGDGLPSIVGAVEEPVIVGTLGFGPPDLVEPGFAALRAALGDADSGRAFATFLREPSYAGAYDAESLARARAVKASLDPEGRFVGSRAYG